MVYLVIDKDCANKIFTVNDPEIELQCFKTEEEAKYYLKYGKKKNNDNNDKDTIVVFTDGSCTNNGYKNAKAGIGVYFNENDERNVSRAITGKQTNNTAELSAVIEVFTILENDIKENKKITIYTDSEYVIKCCGSYGEKCERSKWRNKKGYIPNHELVKLIYELFKQNDAVTINHVKAHTGKQDYLSKGNEGADLLANKAIH